MSARAIPSEIEASFEEASERRGRDRRAGDRRAARRDLHPLFAATLVNHVARPEASATRRYRSASELRSGVIVNFKA